jgi:peptidoglycan-associated lipoprotein
MTTDRVICLTMWCSVISVSRHNLWPIFQEKVTMAGNGSSVGRRLLTAPLLTAAALGVGVAALNVAPAVADDATWDYWIGGGARFYEAHEDNQSGQLYALMIDYNVDPTWTVEGTLGGGPFFEGNNYYPPDGRSGEYNNKGTPGENWGLLGGLDALYHFDSSTDRQWDPYATVGGGTFLNGKQRQGDQWTPYAGPGVGVAYKVDDALDLRLDYKLAVALDEGKINHHVLALVSYDFGDAGAGGNGSGDELGQKSSKGLETVYFDYDSSKIRKDQVEVVKRNADWLKSHASDKASLDGYCDERGTTEYNMALGERRARSALDYLRTLGVPADQLSTRSFGEEFPADPGHNEAAWSKNRRVETVIGK